MRRYLLVTLALFATAFAQDFTAPVRDRLVGKMLVIRHFYPGTTLQYDAHGRLVGGMPPEYADELQLGTWSESGLVTIDNVSYDGQQLTLSGTRMTPAFDQRAGTLHYAPIRPSRKHVPGAIDPRVTITLAAANDEQVQAALNQIFLTREEKLAELVPPYWRGCLTEIARTDTNDWRCHVPAANETPGVFRVGPDVQAPRALSTPDPFYSRVGSQGHISGTVMLWVVVGEDGNVRDVRLQRPLGYGLDESAVAAVKQWHFDAARMKSTGAPVAVALNVEVNFKLL